MSVESKTEEKRTWYGARVFETTIAEHNGFLDNKVWAQEIGNDSESSQKRASDTYQRRKDEE